MGPERTLTALGPRGAEGLCKGDAGSGAALPVCSDAPPPQAVELCAHRPCTLVTGRSESLGGSQLIASMATSSPVAVHLGRGHPDQHQESSGVGDPVEQHWLCRGPLRISRSRRCVGCGCLTSTLDEDRGPEPPCCGPVGGGVSQGPLGSQGSSRAA